MGYDPQFDPRLKKSAEQILEEEEGQLTYLEATRVKKPTYCVPGRRWRFQKNVDFSRYDGEWTEAGVMDGMGTYWWPPVPKGEG